MNFPSRLHLKSKFLALTMMVGSASSATFTYTPVNAGDKAELLPGMSLEQVNFAGGEFGTTGTTYPAVNFDAYKAESTGVQLLFSIPEGSYRLDMPQGVDACYGVKWVAPEGQVFTNLNIELLNEGLNDTPFQGSVRVGSDFRDSMRRDGCLPEKARLRGSTSVSMNPDFA